MVWPMFMKWTVLQSGVGDKQSCCFRSHCIGSDNLNGWQFCERTINSDFLISNSFKQKTSDTNKESGEWMAIGGEKTKAEKMKVGE